MLKVGQRGPYYNLRWSSLGAKFRYKPLEIHTHKQEHVIWPAKRKQSVKLTLFNI